MNKRLISIAIISITLIGITAIKLLSNKTAVEKKIYIHDLEAAILVEAETPQLHTFSSAYSYLGTLDPFRQNTIGSDAQGKLAKLMVEEGDKVAAGQILAKIDDDLLQLQLENISLSLESQKNDERRNANLVKENAIPGVQVEKTELGVRSAEIQKKQIQKQLQNTSIKAPFSGIVTKKMVDLGSVIGPGSPLFELTDISKLKLTISVPERDILKFNLHQTVDINVDIYGDRKFAGKVSNISVQADKSHNFKVQITLDNARRELMAGMYATAKLSNTTSITGLAIPRKALIGSTKKPQVFVIRNGKAMLTTFQAGTADGAYIEVINGLDKNDRIVIKGQVNLQDKSNVKTN
jgi:RND family efflux transporter MFP subunit